VIGNVFSLILKGYAVAQIPFSLKIKIKKSKTAVIQRYKIEPDFFKRNEVPVKDGICILYKRVSEDFKTLEGSSNETVWPVGTTLDHPNWNPGEQECGSGKFHACDIPAACDEFRYEKLDDKYIAVEVKISDTCQWQNPEYPHKIAFRKGTVLYECDRNGKKIENLK
jgi:hypothetical protein